MTFLSRTSIIRLIRIILIVIVVLFISGYGISRSLNYARGPEIVIIEPISGSTIHSQTVKMVGRADRINNLSLNGSPISIDEQGNFNQNLVVFSGVNIWTLEGKDQFNRKTSLQLKIFGNI